MVGQVNVLNQYKSKRVLLGDIYLPTPLGGPKGPLGAGGGPKGPPRGGGRYISPNSTSLDKYWL